MGRTTPLAVDHFVVVPRVRRICRLQSVPFKDNLYWVLSRPANYAPQTARDSRSAYRAHRYRSSRDFSN